MPRNRGNVDTRIPDDYAEDIGGLAEDPAYIAAWTHAAEKGNPPKACRVYADNHWQEFEAKTPRTQEEIEAEIARLEKEKEGLAS